MFECPKCYAYSSLRAQIEQGGTPPSPPLLELLKLSIFFINGSIAAKHFLGTAPEPNAVIKIVLTKPD